MKKIRIEMPNGDQFDLEADIVARDRGIYFANKEVGERAENSKEWWKVYSAEREEAIADDTELIDWLGNQMKWEDFGHKAVLVPRVAEKPDYNKQFSVAKLRVVEGTGSR